jgi:hypothetical protein
MFVPCILNRGYIIMSSYEAPLPQYLNCWTVSGSALLGGISIGGTPFVFLVIMLLCIAISCVLQNLHLLTHRRIFAL